ncbi:glycosyltransferase [Burkholderia singularis]|uniref:glycosyltransferase n=1 Tax=Burkholderia singularis TaxID=1503053 RepID=UPI000B32E81D|nr:glycosyltransferase [Burkholderia singularis]
MLEIDALYAVDGLRNTDMNISNVPILDRENDLTEFRWSIDHLAVNEDGALLLFGWALHVKREIKRLIVVCHGSDGEELHFPVTYGTERVDVARSMPEVIHASASGFYYFGHLPLSGKTSVSLKVTLADGSSVTLPSGREVEKKAAASGVSSATTRTRIQAYRYLLGRAWHFAASGRFTDLGAAAARYLRNRPPKVAGGLDGILSRLSQQKETVLVIDHDLGGGANQFRRKLMRDLVSSNAQVLLLTFHLPSLRYAIELHVDDELVRVAVNGERLFTELQRLPLNRIHYNNSVSFTNQLSLLHALILIHSSRAVPITFYLHDYHSICPSHFLLDNHGKFCNIPDLQRCAKCLPAMSSGLVSLFAERDIGLWRKVWFDFLTQTTEIVCFSNASLQLLLKAYPGLADHRRLVVRPHDMSDFPVKQITFDLDRPLNIGVVGRINEHKGAAIVAEMADALERRNKGERITVLGTLDAARVSGVLHVTGAYERDKLSDLVDKHQINMIAFTSIWPETFSFVVSEVMNLGLPIVCFDMGAPAERVRSYSLGKEIPFCDGATLVETIAAFKDELRKKRQLHRV